MKRLIAGVLALFLFGARAFAINEDVVAWEQILNDVTTDEQRVSVIMKIMEFKDRDFTPVLVNALEKAVSVQEDVGTATEHANRNILKRLIVQELGNLKSIESAETVFRVYDGTKDAVLKSEAARSLGKMRATEYAERLSVDLAAINLAPVASDSKNREIVALALVESLASLRSPLGYEPVFLASIGWYSLSSGVKEAAKSAMLTMLDDPGDKINEIIAANPAIDVKSVALATLLASSASREKKIAGAAKTLRIAIDRSASDPVEMAAIGKLRVASIVALASLGDSSPENVPLYVAVIKMDKKNDATMDETLRAYVALGVNGSDDAALYLASVLSDYNEREKSKANTVRDKALLKQIVTSMAATKNPLVKNALVQAQFIDYDSGILTLIGEAISKLP